MKVDVPTTFWVALVNLPHFLDKLYASFNLDLKKYQEKIVSTNPNLHITCNKGLAMLSILFVALKLHDDVGKPTSIEWGRAN